MASLTLRGLRKRLGENEILRGIDLDVEDGAFVVLVGPSGCGKSTLLRTIAGLETPDAGEVRIGDVDVTERPPRERDVAMVFQSYALYPHLSVGENLAFGLKLRKEPASVIEARVAEVAGMLGLDDLLERYPRQLSGGQRQRVAMGRAIARRPRLFLFDEPLSNLDAALRTEVRVEIKRLHARLASTMVYVTHDQVEAMTLADQLVVLNRGEVEQAGPPLEVYHRPASRFVAAFMGSPAMNFLEVAIEGGEVVADGVRLDAPALDDAPARALLGVRPHDVVEAEDGGLEMTVDVVEAMGFEAYAHGRVGEARFVARVPGERAAGLARGDVLRLAVDRESLHLFDLETERAIR